jgi:hypothetical protein
MDAPRRPGAFPLLPRGRRRPHRPEMADGEPPLFPVNGGSRHPLSLSLCGSLTGGPDRTGGPSRQLSSVWFGVQIRVRLAISIGFE